LLVSELKDAGIISTMSTSEKIFLFDIKQSQYSIYKSWKITLLYRIKSQPEQPIQWTL